MLSSVSVSGSLWIYLGRWLDRKGLNALAESCYRNAVSIKGAQAPEAAYRLSQMLLAKSANREAVDVCVRALHASDKNAKLWCALGAAYRRLADMENAKMAYEKAIVVDAAYAPAWSNLGEWWLARGDLPQARSNTEKALSLDANLVQALNNRVAVLYEQGKFQLAEEAAVEAIERHPEEGALHVNLANILFHTGKTFQAAKEFRKALECDPNLPEAQLGLSSLLGESHRLAETLEYFEHEIAVKGESVQRLASIAVAQQAKGNWAAAEITCRKVLELQPNNISALITLSSCLSNRADHVGSIEMNRRALAENPRMPPIYSNIAFNSTYLPDISPQEVFEYHREWSDRFEAKAGTDEHAYVYEQTRDRERVLRIGYVSGDFSTHPVGFLLRDVIRHHNKDRFQIFCYSMMRSSDNVTDAIRQAADVWVDALFMSDEELANKIHEDRIDILVDLSGHTAYNRLAAFVRKPAPVQATWIGYFHSTGLQSIDYFISDPHTTPPSTSQLFSETPVWLPHSRFCYSPPVYAPEVAPAPVGTRQHITFGSFNRIEKLVEPVIAAWVSILNGVPGSRLVIKSGALDTESVRDELSRRFVDHGLAPERLDLRGPSPHPDMLDQYGDIDIALDPFPFNGGMTTLEALWMGVPVVTFAGEGVVSRQSTSALHNIGLGELVFDDKTAYIADTIALANDHQRVAGLRQEIRQRMKHSPLCQPDQFTEDLEALYRRMWQAWCEGKKLGTEVVPGTPVKRKQVLHVGCGPADLRSMPQHFQSRWQEIRLDIDPKVNPDVIATMLDMSPVESQSVDAIYSSHNLEHLHPHEVEVALKEFRRVLKPDGFLVLTCPDLQSVCALVAEGRLDDTAYMSAVGPIAPIDMLYGHRPAMAAGNLYMAHKTGFTDATLTRALESSGFATAVVSRGQHFDLWALGYPVETDEKRIEADKKTCFPRYLVT